MNLDEREAIQALYCLPGECEFSGNEVTIRTKIDGFDSSDGSTTDSESQSVKVVFYLGKDYPHQFPQISLFTENLNREAISRVKSKVLQDCDDLLGEPMLISLISSVRENVQLELELKHSFTEDSVDNQNARYKCVSDDGKIWTSILHIDHMRSKNKYCKTLEKWASELTLCGKILFCNKLIIVLLQGETENIKNFVVRLKTVSIDVDSKGHSCKERMMTVLCEEQNNLAEIVRLENFERREINNREQLEKIFFDIGLVSLYNKFVRRLH